MRKGIRVTYEWVFEPLDENGDIIDPQFSDDLNDLLKHCGEYFGDPRDIALIRYIGDIDDGILDSDYYYINQTHGCFLDKETSYTGFEIIPKRFISELEKVWNNNPEIFQA
tara:strand:- start:1004 stop:1336 length:333 start_codon:yes stop_codon:yes gene_type:complete